MLYPLLRAEVGLAIDVTEWKICRNEWGRFIEAAIRERRRLALDDLRAYMKSLQSDPVDEASDQSSDLDSIPAVYQEAACPVCSTPADHASTYYYGRKNSLFFPSTEGGAYREESRYYCTNGCGNYFPVPERIAVLLEAREDFKATKLEGSPPQNAQLEKEIESAVKRLKGETSCPLCATGLSQNISHIWIYDPKLLAGRLPHAHASMGENPERRADVSDLADPNALNPEDSIDMWDELASGEGAKRSQGLEEEEE
jgi:hypothetical protein